MSQTTENVPAAENVPAVIEEFKVIISAAPKVLLTNQNRVEKAVAFGNQLIEKVKDETMTAELDEAIRSYLEKVKKTRDQLLEDRSPLTKIFDKVKTEFTILEATLDVKDGKTIPYTLQTYRNNYAKQLVEKKRLDDEAAQLKLNIENEKTRLTAEIKTILSEACEACITTKHQQLTDIFNNCTIETYQESLEKISKFSMEPPKIALDTRCSKVVLSAWYVKPDDVNAIITGMTSDPIYDDYRKRYSNIIADQMINLKDKMPSKLQELQELAEKKRQDEEAAERARIAAAAAAAELDAKKKAEAEQRAKEAQEAADKAKADREKQEEEIRLREEAEKQRLAKEAEQKAKESKDKIELEAATAQATSLFDNVVANTESAPAVKTVESYNIEVKSPAGWMLLINFWFTKEGLMTAPEDCAKLGNKKLDSMKTFAEKHYKKTGEKIESPFIVYHEVITAK